MTVALGRQPLGRKSRAGDGRTPEGVYWVAERPRASELYHRFIPLSYPSRADAAQARAAGAISERIYNAILDAHDIGQVPPQHTPMGGDIGIHGEGERWRGYSQSVDWTFGCVAVTDAEIDFLANRVRAGTPVTIHP
jgi:murein L,D-transpeptidase YafK